MDYGTFQQSSLLKMGVALAANTPHLMNTWKNTKAIAVHFSYARRQSTEPLYWTKGFRSDIDLSGYRIIAHVFTVNEHYSLMYSKNFGLKHLFIINAKMFCYKVTEI